MYRLRRLPPAVLLLLLVGGGAVAAQPSATQDPTAPQRLNNFQPSLAVVIGILSIMFSVTFILLVYAKFCHRASAAAQAAELLRQQGLARSASRFSGIDKTVIESLPFFRFSSLRGDRDGLECAVCISKFEDVEILRLLPKCKHAFHINCIDQWLEKHSSCPICRSVVNADDPTVFAYSNSMRMMWSQPEEDEESATVAAEADRGIAASTEELGLFVQREESGSRRLSSRFSIGGSFRKAGGSKSGRKEDQTPILEETGDDENGGDKGKIGYHKFNHRIVVPDLAFKNRWSSVSSSDLMFLSSEMLNDAAGERFSSLDHQSGSGQRQLTGPPPAGSSNNSSSYRPADSANAVSYSREIVNSPADRRAVSELTGVSRFRGLGMESGGGPAAGDERQRQAWIPIVRRTAEWFANREKRKTAADTLDV